MLGRRIRNGSGMVTKEEKEAIIIDLPILIIREDGEIVVEGAVDMTKSPLLLHLPTLQVGAIQL